MIKKLNKYLLIGFLSIIPGIITFQIALFIYEKSLALIFYINGYTNDWISTGLAIFLSLVFLILVGYSVVKYGSSTYIKIIDAFAEKLPIVKNIYSIIKKVLDVFFSEHNNLSEVVYIEYPRKGIWVPAYVTNKKENVYILFIPTSPNPTSGFTVIVNEKEVIKSEMTMEEATSFIISIGVDLEKEEIIKELIEIGNVS